MNLPKQFRKTSNFQLRFNMNDCTWKQNHNSGIQQQTLKATSAKLQNTVCSHLLPLLHERNGLSLLFKQSFIFGRRRCTGAPHHRFYFHSMGNYATVVNKSINKFYVCENANIRCVCAWALAGQLDSMVSTRRRCHRIIHNAYAMAPTMFFIILK